jgi:hypothetical protein
MDASSGVLLHIHCHCLPQWPGVPCQVQTDSLTRLRLYYLFETPSEGGGHFCAYASMQGRHTVRHSRALPNHLHTGDCAEVRGILLPDGPLAYHRKLGFLWYSQSQKDYYYYLLFWATEICV